MPVWIRLFDGFLNTYLVQPFNPLLGNFLSSVDNVIITNMIKQRFFYLVLKLFVVLLFIDNKQYFFYCILISINFIWPGKDHQLAVLNNKINTFVLCKYVINIQVAHTVPQKKKQYLLFLNTNMVNNV